MLITLGAALRVLGYAANDWLFGGILVLGAGIAFNGKVDRLLTAVARVITAWRRRGDPPASPAPEPQPGPPRPSEARDGD
jgi:hypothetical protein